MPESALSRDVPVDELVRRLAAYRRAKEVAAFLAARPVVWLPGRGVKRDEGDAEPAGQMALEVWKVAS